MLIGQYIAFSIVGAICAFSIFLAYIVFISPPPITTDEFVGEQPPTTCKDSNPVSICKTRDACCSNTNYDYFCTHPLTQLCNKEHDKCITAAGFDALYPVALREDKCKKQRNICCTTFDQIATDNAAFENIGEAAQNTDIIGNYLAMTEKERAHCGKMCQTDDKCAAVKISPAGCQFYSSAHPAKSRLAPLTHSATTEFGYFKKK